MTKATRDNISIIYGSEYAIIKAKMDSNMQVLTALLLCICDEYAASTTISKVMSCMSDIIRGKCTVCDAETGTQSIISVHVDTSDIIVSFTGFQINSEVL